MDAHANAVPVKSAKAMKMADLEEDTWQLVKNRVEYDRQAIKVYQARLTRFEGALYQQKLAHRMLAWENSQGAAEAFMARNVKILNSTQAEENLRRLSDFKSEFCLAYGLQADKLVPVVVLNWAAVCRVRDSLKSCQATMTGVILNQSPLSMGVVVMPEFSYKRGQSWRAEFSCLEALNNGGVFVDRSLSIQFASRKDSRDTRPLVYKARLAMGQGIKDKEWAFAGCPLVKDGRTPPIEQLASGDMATVEDCTTNALPHTTDADGTVAGARKFEQLGKACYTTLIENALESVEVDANGGILLVDLNMSPGDMFQGWIQQRQQWTKPSAYIALTDDDIAEEWLLQTQKEFLTKGHLADEITMPGSARISPELPDDLVGEKPKPPTLHVLTLGGPQKDYPVVPDQLARDRHVAVIFFKFFFLCFEIFQHNSLFSHHVRTGSSTQFMAQNGDPSWTRSLRSLGRCQRQQLGIKVPTKARPRGVPLVLMQGVQCAVAWQCSLRRL